jgi:hypothetical protein
MPAKKLVVYIWSLDTTSQTDSIDTRKTNLENALRAAYADLGQPARSDGISPKGLFIAPEYLFAKPVSSGSSGHTLGSGRQLEEGEKDLLVNYMKHVSSTMPDLLIIAGTVAWRKPFERPVDKQKRSRDGSDKTQSRLEKARAAIEEYAKTAFPSASTPLSQHLSGAWRQSSTSSSVAATTSAKKLEDLSVNAFFSEPAGFVGRNTAYVLLNGDVLFKYNKRGDFHEVLHDNSADGTVFVPGLFDGRFLVKTAEQPPRSIEFGLEICLDHAVGMLERTVAPKGRVDVHLITSASVAVEPKNVAVKDQGYLVHASSNASYSKAQVCPGLTDVPTTVKLHSNTVTAYTLDLHSVPDAVPLPVFATVTATAPSTSSEPATKKSRTMPGTGPELP